MNVEVKEKSYNLDTLKIKSTKECEQEVVATRVATDDNIVIYTSDNVILNKFKKLVQGESDWKFKEIYETRSGEITGASIEGPFELITVRKQKIKKKELAPEKRKQLADRMAQIRAKRTKLKSE